MTDFTHHSKTFCVCRDRVDGHKKAKELVCSGCCHVEGQHSQINILHTEELFLSIGAVCDVHKLIQLRRKDLLILSTKTEKIHQVANMKPQVRTHKVNFYQSPPKNVLDSGQQQHEI